MFVKHPAVLAGCSDSAQDKFDEGFTRIHIDRIAGGHRDHRNSRRVCFVRAWSCQGIGAGAFMPE
jgi:hypothetical protein